MAAVIPYTSMTAVLCAVLGATQPHAPQPADVAVVVAYVGMSAWALYVAIHPLLYVGLVALAVASYVGPPYWTRLLVPVGIIIGAAVTSPTHLWVPIVCAAIVAGRHTFELVRGRAAADRPQ